MIDFSKIPKDKIVSIRIPDRGCAEFFLDEMRMEFPEKVGGWPYGLLSLEHDIDGTVYIPHFECKLGMTYATAAWAVEHKYPIIEWQDIISAVDEFDIELSEMSLDMLFG